MEDCMERCPEPTIDIRHTPFPKSEPPNVIRKVISALMKRFLHIIILFHLVIASMTCNAQNEKTLFRDLNFVNGICDKTIIATPTEIMKSVWMDTACAHCKPPISMLAFIYNNYEYSFNIEYNLEDRYVDSIITLADSRCKSLITIKFYQYCSETYMGGCTFPLGIITDISPLDAIGKDVP